jgi:xylulokinase
MIACGIDIGTTKLKVVLIDAAGRVLGQLARPTPRVEENGAPVTDPGALLAIIEAMLIAIWRQSGAPGPVTAISTTGVGEDGFLVDAGLRPLTRAIPWFDRRAVSEADELEASHSAQARTGLTFELTRTAPKWLWLSRNTPKLPDATWISVTDYPLAAWSGTPFISETLAARTACYDVADRRWIDELLAASSAPALPPVLPGAAIIGRMRSDALVSSGVATRETALVAGGHDHPVAASFIRRRVEDAIVDSLGTAELIYAETGHYNPLPRTGLVHSPAILKSGGQALTYVFELARTIQPLSDLPDALELFDAAANAPGIPSTDPWLPTDRAIAELPTRLQTTASDRLSIVRSVLEGCAFVARSVIDEMQLAGGIAGPLYCSGGRSRSDSWMKFRANAIGVPVYRLAEDEQAALGAAFIALSAVAPEGWKPAPSAVTTFQPTAIATGYTARFAPLAAAFRALRAPPQRPIS